MPDMELNHADKWLPPPDHAARLEMPGLSAHLLACPDQFLVSGDLHGFGRVSGLDPAGVGALGQVAAPRYALRLARDRLLIVGPLTGIAEGWNPAGFAVTACGAALAVIELSGAAVPDVLARATLIDSATPGPSTAVSFAGVPAMIYRKDRVVRLHVERGLVAYLWLWLDATAKAAAL